MNKNTMLRKAGLALGIVAFFLVLAYGFVPGVLSGKVVNQSDISGYVGMSHEMKEFNAAHPDDPTLWTDAMFGGMPVTAFHASSAGNWTAALEKVLLTGKRPATWLFLSLLGGFLLMLALGVDLVPAVIGAVAVTFCSYNLQIIQVGHNSKMQALAFFPWVLAALVYTYRKARNGGPKWLLKTLFGAVLFALALSLQIKANHQQITYYLALVILIYAVTELVWLLADAERRRGFGRFAAASGLLLTVGLVGVGTNTVSLAPLYEYTKYTMRGGSELTAPDGKEISGSGLQLDYATAWSYGWEELPNLMIPNFNGGSSSGSIDPDKSATVQLFARAGQGNPDEIAKALPFYWGPQPFTAGPMYMGAITIFLFLLGLLLYDGREKWWLLAATLLAVALALGSHFMAFTRFFYDHVPMYNKFRTVSMALVVLQFTLPMLGILVLDRILKGAYTRKEFLSKGWIALGLTAGFCLLCAVAPGIAGDFSGGSDGRMQDVLVDALRTDRRHLLAADALRSAPVATPGEVEDRIEGGRERPCVAAGAVVAIGEQLLAVDVERQSIRSPRQGIDMVCVFSAVEVHGVGLLRVLRVVIGVAMDRRRHLIRIGTHLLHDVDLAARGPRVGAPVHAHGHHPEGRPRAASLGQLDAGLEVAVAPAL